jgi:hypothetical protein
MNRTTLLALFLLVATGATTVAAQDEAPPPVNPPHRILLQLEEHAPDAMSSADRETISARQDQVNAAIAAAGYDLQQGSWTQVQSACPVFPGAVFMRFSSDEGTPHASRFVAVVPRGSAEVRIVPVTRAGNASFSLAYKNEGTVSVFNQLLTDEKISVYDPSMSHNDTWVKLALCYAALAGEQPTTLLTDTLYGEAFERNVNVPIRRVETNGGMNLEFCDVNDPKATIQWDLEFNPHGQLAKVTRVPRPLNTPIRTLKTQTDLVSSPPPHK